ncbi:Arginine--tRNA ligase [Rickettsiales endosymbiont of Paramecium tredecaurelia]|uniref:arginine--tRNA ligase n=1 Tax=Candidatus Sarmatiella mevalonica TaxID=2770581 RepID=UPI00244566B5|nr:arginine--tRNA ligase [Candidatus Sarmatiella mevalonica]MBL3284288.1 Arginine--tRNA ligase [Candidatus Sarmatiella mevalonica]
MHFFDNIFINFKNIINDAVIEICKTSISSMQERELRRILPAISIEIPPGNQTKADLATNAAMILAKMLKRNPMELANQIKDKIKQPFVKEIEIISPGFINFYLDPSVWRCSIANILTKDKLTVDLIANKELNDSKKINLEYVSANPTGPLHIGHVRGAVYGNALANLLKYCNLNVTREYYINDAGAQIDTLTQSLWIRYNNVAHGANTPIPDGLYPGQYLIDAAQQLYQLNPRLNQHDEACNKIVRDFALDYMMKIIKSDLQQLEVEHDLFFSESSLHSAGAITKVLEELRRMNLIYEGVLPRPKDLASNAPWEERAQILFKATQFGDDQDRALVKSDGSWTYFAAECAYIKDKIDRGFNYLIFILGADHIGYVKRLNAVCKAFNQDVSVEVKVCQMVNLMKHGVPVKMSKRSGNFAAAQDALDVVDPNVIKFIMLTRKNDALLDFDLEKVVEQSKENPAFYVQYANVRINSIIRKAQENGLDVQDHSNFALLTQESEIDLARFIAFWQKVLESSASSFEVHRVVFYAIQLASKFHALWNENDEGVSYKFIVPQNLELTNARVGLARAVQKVLLQIFSIIGVQAMQSM